MEYLAFAAPAVLTLVIGYFLGRIRPKVTTVQEIQALAPELPAKMAVGHKHEATTANPGGWFCDCGVHRHVYVFTIPGMTDRRCQCGAIGTGKEWSDD